MWMVGNHLESHSKKSSKGKKKQLIFCPSGHEMKNSG